MSLQDINPYCVYLNQEVNNELLQWVKEKMVDGAHMLSQQEILYIRSACNGFSHKDIADINFKSLARINNVFHEIHLKTGCETSYDLIRYARMFKIIEWNKLETDHPKYAKEP